MKSTVADINGGVSPTEEDSGMLISSVIVNVHMCRREGGKRRGLGTGKGLKNG
jgi:hypothetical protein